MRAISAARTAFVLNLRATEGSKSWQETRDERRYRSEWIDYINLEVNALCKANDWTTQIRRKWSVRHEPAGKESLSDLEWKIWVSGQPGPQSDPYATFVYYLLSYCHDRHVFVFKHDTIQVGMRTPAHNVTTYSEVAVPHPNPESGWHSQYFGLTRPEMTHPDGIPPERWLQSHLEMLTDRFQPNQYCYT